MCYKYEEGDCYGDCANCSVNYDNGGDPNFFETDDPLIETELDHIPELSYMEMTK